MSYVYRYDEISEPGEKCEIIGFNGLKQENLKDFLGDQWSEETKFKELIVRKCWFSLSQMEELHQLVQLRASSRLWRVHFHRSIIQKSGFQPLNDIFDLLHTKPIVDLKLDNLDGLSLDKDNTLKLSKLCTTNTSVRDRQRVETLTNLMLTYTKLKQNRQKHDQPQDISCLSLNTFREVIKYAEAENMIQVFDISINFLPFTSLIPVVKSLPSQIKELNLSFNYFN